MTTAVIFVPADIPEDGQFTQECLAHLERRGYQLGAAPLRNWDLVLQILRARLATVVVIARREHFDPGYEPRVEFVGEETQRIVTESTQRRAWLSSRLPRSRRGRRARHL